MNKLVRYVGALGLGFLVAGLFLLAMQREREGFWGAFLITGLVLSAIYIASRWNELAATFSHRSAKEGANAGVLILIVSAIVVLINVIADRQKKQWDFTAAKQYSLSEQTAKILDGLETKIDIVLLERRGTEAQIEAEDLLKLYDDESPRVSLELIDPEAEPERALVYTKPTEPVTLGTIFVVAGERRQKATAATEPELTNAIIRALATDTKKIYFTSGHREKDPLETDESGISVVRSKLDDSAYETEQLVIARTLEGDRMRIPGDTAALVVAGPRTDFLPEELDALEAYLEGGGGAVFLVDPETQSVTPELSAFLLELGIELGKDVVVDALAQPPIYPVVQSYGQHSIVRSFSNVMSIFPLVRSVRAVEDVPAGTRIRELFTTADENSWAETRLEELRERRGPAPGEERGPIGLAVAATIDRGTQGPDGEDVKPSRLVVVGDSDFITNELATAPLLNADLFLNMVNWVAQDEDLISIRPREPEDRRIALTAQQQANVFFLALFIIPGIVVITGISSWWSRRATPSRR